MNGADPSGNYPASNCDNVAEGARQACLDSADPEQPPIVDDENTDEVDTIEEVIEVIEEVIEAVNLRLETPWIPLYYYGNLGGSQEIDVKLSLVQDNGSELTLGPLSTSIGDTTISANDIFLDFNRLPSLSEELNNSPLKSILGFSLPNLVPGGAEMSIRGNLSVDLGDDTTLTMSMRMTETIHPDRGVYIGALIFAAVVGPEVNRVFLPSYQQCPECAQ